jgi:hypothetical protein
MLMARPAAANDQRALVSLSVTGPTSCEDGAALEREVKRRSEELIFVSPETAPVTVDVKVSDRDDGLEATIVIQRPGEAPSTRVIAAGNCQELLEGAALVIAVVLARHRPESRHSLAAETSQVAEQEVSQSPKPPVADSAHSDAWRVGVGAAAVVSAGMGPGSMSGVEASLRVGVELGAVFPELGLGLRRIARSDFPVNDARAMFLLTSGVVSLCPFAAEIGEAVSLRPCAVASYGDLEASGEGVENPRSESHPFAGVGLGLRLEAALLPPLSLEVSLSSEAALIKSRFHIEGDKFHETAPVAGYAVVGLILRP